MSDIANLLMGFSGTLKPESTTDINNNTLQQQGIRQNDITLQYQAEQRKAQIAALAQRQQAMQQYLTDPNPKSYNQLMVLAPDLRESAKQGFDAMTVDAQKQHLQDSSTQLGYVQAGDWDNSIKHIDQVIAADDTAKKDTSEDAAYKALLIKAKNGDQAAAKQALALAQLHTATILGPDKFAEAYPALAKLPSDIANTEATTGKTDAETYRILHPAPNMEVAPQTDANGNPVLYDKTGQLPTQSFGNPVGGVASNSYSDYLNKLGVREGTGDNPNSSATGPGQFVDGTWRAVAKQLPWGKGKTDAELDAMKNSSNPKLKASPEQFQQALDQFNKQNYSDLQSSGLDTNATHMYAMHLLGPAAGKAVIQTSNPNTPLRDVLVKAIGQKQADAYINANRSIMAGKTVGQFIQPIAQKFGTDQVNPFVSRSTAQGKDYLEASDPDQANLVDSIAKGLVPIDQVDTTKAGRREAVIKQVMRVNPNWTPGTYEAMQKVREDYLAGDKNTSLNAINTFFQHVLEYNGNLNDRKQIMSKNLTGDYADGTNQARNFFAGFSDNPLSRNNTDLSQIANNLAHEEATAYKGSKAAEGDIDAFKKPLNNDKPVGLQQAAIASKTLAMTARLNTLTHDYNRAFANNKAPFEFLDPPVQKQIISFLQNHYEKAGTRTNPNRAQIQALQEGKLDPTKFDEKFGHGRSWIYLYPTKAGNNE
jgi:hypothetical protein